jgi:hypothetical protein
MKRSGLILIVPLLFFLLQRCSNDEELTPAKSKVSFSLNALMDAGRTQSSELTNATAVLLSLETTNGDPVLTNQRINLLSFGESFVTEPLELEPGTYSIAAFLLVNDSSDVLFATPVAGSPLAQIVKHPLQVSFHVSAGKSVSVAMEVVPVDAYTPEEFGYVSFSINVVRPLPISVFAIGKTAKLSSATAYIIKDIDTLATLGLGAKVNVIPFKLDIDETYTLVIIKDGYSRFTRNFIYNDLIEELNGSALKVYLNEALTFTLKTTFGEYNPEWSVVIGSLEGADVMVDWGDGTSQAVTIGASDYGDTFQRQYPNATASYFVTITGEINKITLWDSNPSEATYGKINFEHLPELRMVNFFVGGSGTLDLTHNYKIKHIVFGGNKLLLPQHHDLSIVVIYGEALAPSLDNIIQNVAENAIAKTITGGIFQYSENPDSDSEIGLGTPSAASISLLETLAYAYQWSIYPSI